ncbi:MAG: DNA-binding protein HU-beta [Azoarcus sp.]|nr:DNA-binding protein HU-beta [Azoarcus sp.]
MNKSELIAVIAEKTALSKSNVDKVLEAFIDVVQEAVASGDKVALMGFGAFERAELFPRMGRNPQTGESISLEGGFRPKFSAGAGFKERVREPAK